MGYYYLTKGTSGSSLNPPAWDLAVNQLGTKHLGLTKHQISQLLDIDFSKSPEV